MHRFASAKKSANGVDAKHSLKALQTELGQRLCRVHDTCVVDQGVQAPELYICHGKKTANLLFAAHIRLNGHGVPAHFRDLRDNRIGCRLVCIEAEQYIPACRCCLQRGGCANASAASGDEHNFVFHGAPW